MINNILWPQLEEVDLDNIWFQQDGAACHTACATTELLREIQEIVTLNGLQEVVV